MAQAIDPATLELILKTTNSDVVKDLAALIKLVKERMVELAQEYKDGVHSEEQYIRSSNILISALKEKEELFARITVAEKNQIAIEKELKDAADELAGSGDGESGSGGFAGAAGGMIKLEKAISSIATGHGLGRLGSMLEGIVGLLGGPAGSGLAAGGIFLCLRGLFRNS